MKNLLKRNEFPLLIILSVLLFFVHLSAIPVSIMEARNFVTSREMLTENHWLLTTINNVPRYQKPPLPSWIGSIFGYLLGAGNLVAYRLSTAIMAVVSLVFWYFFSLRISSDKTTAFISGAVLATTFYFFAIQREAPTDLYAHGFMIMAIYYLFQVLNSSERLWQAGLLAAVFFGCSILCKGPIGIYALFLPFIIAYFGVYRFDRLKKRVWPLLVSVLLGSAIGLSWFVYVRYADYQSFIAIARQETANWANHRVRPFYYYWSFLIQTGIWTIPSAVGLLYPYLKDRVADKKAYLFTLAWALLAVLLLSIVPEKKERYLFPALIPLALNTAFYLRYIVGCYATLTRAEKWPIVIHFWLIASVAFFAPFVFYLMPLKGGQSLPQPWMLLFYIGSLACAGFMAVSLIRGRLYQAFVLSLLFVSLVFCCILPMATLIFDPVKRAAMAQPPYTDQEKIYSFGEHAPELYWAYGRVVPRLDNNAKKVSLFIPDGRCFKVLVSNDALPDFFKKFEADFTVREQFTFDLNYTAEPGRKHYNKYWVSKLFLVCPKAGQL